MTSDKDENVINNSKHVVLFYFTSEAVVQSCSVKKLFLKISQNSQENTCARVSFFKTLT